MPIHSAYFILTDTERKLIREIFIELHTYAYTQVYFILTDTERKLIREIFIEVYTYAYTQCLLHTDRHREKAKKRNIYRSLHLCLYYILIDRELF